MVSELHVTYSNILRSKSTYSYSYQHIYSCIAKNTIVNVSILVFVELFYTERNHLRNLKIMHQVYYQRMLRETQWITRDLVSLLFPNLEEMILLHQELNHSFRKRKERDVVVGDIADLLIARVSERACTRIRLLWGWAA